MLTSVRVIRVTRGWFPLLFVASFIGEKWRLIAVTDFAAGLSGKSTGLTGKSTGLSGFATGVSEKSIGLNEKSTGVTEKTVAPSDFTAGLSVDTTQVRPAPTRSR